MDWSRHRDAFNELLKNAEFTDRAGAPLAPREAFARLVALAEDCRRRKGFCYCIGNGASASMAAHFAADAGKNAALRTMVFTDPALLTAIGNDIAYTEVYAEPLRRYCGRDDLLFAVSSSGNSPNIVAAVRVARERGAAILTFSAMRPDNAIRALGDVNAWVPADSYGDAESAHAFMLHHWLDALTGQGSQEHDHG
jgi:D-sedoheptulose 7-phosphate isomerase